MNQTINDTINQTVIPKLFGTTVPLTFSPVFDILIIALIGSLFVTLVNKYLGDQTKIKALKLEMKELRKKSREAMMKDPKKAQKIQQEMMQKSMENMKYSMNPKIMLTTMVPMLLLLSVVRKYYSPFGEILNLRFTSFTWLGTYIVFSIICSIILRKVLDVA